MQLILSWSPQWNPSGTGQTKKSFNTWSRHPLSWKFCSTFFFLLLCILLLCQAKRSTLMNFGDTHWMPNKTSIISQNFRALTRWIRIWHVNSLTLYKQHLLAKGQPLFIRWSIIKISPKPLPKLISKHLKGPQYFRYLWLETLKDLWR